MVATFCARLAFGMIAPLLLLDPTPIPPRFFRVQYLATLGLLMVEGYFLRDEYSHDDATRASREALWIWPLNCLFCLAGSIVWHLRDAPGGKWIHGLTALGLGVSLALLEPTAAPDQAVVWRLADQFGSAAVVGTATTAMLLGHSYLISPAMTIVPLQRLILALAAALLTRVGWALGGLWFWTAEHPLASLETETMVWLAARWLLGILAPLTLGWMAWETTRIRSTQSATGILYVVVIVVYLGELTSLLLFEKTGAVL